MHATETTMSADLHELGDWIAEHDAAPFVSQIDVKDGCRLSVHLYGHAPFQEWFGDLPRRVEATPLRNQIVTVALPFADFYRFEP